MQAGDRFFTTPKQPEHCSVPGCTEPCVELEGVDDPWFNVPPLWLLYCETHIALGENEPIEGILG